MLLLIKILIRVDPSIAGHSMEAPRGAPRVEFEKTGVRQRED
jgi:hypothetical protein